MLLLGSLLVLGFGVIAHGAPRIIGGHEAPNHQYPYQVSFRNLESVHFCSGSILNSHWILTAAHCLEDEVDPKSFTISAGTNYLSEQGIVYLAQFYVLHPNYKHFFHDDIALVRVRGEITFNKFVQTIPLPDRNFDNYGTAAVFAGWGSRKVGGEAPIALQEILLTIITPAQCRAIKRRTTDNHICTYNRFNEGICHGDSGGPLVADGVQVGIASYVTPCALGHPDVYTRVWSYMGWIHDTMQRFEFIFS